MNEMREITDRGSLSEKKIKVKRDLKQRRQKKRLKGKKNTFRNKHKKNNNKEESGAHTRPQHVVFLDRKDDGVVLALKIFYVVRGPPSS